MSGLRVGLLLPVLLAGCAEQDVQRWTGARVVHEAAPSSGVELCGGQVAFADRLVAATSDQWTSGEGALADAPLVVELRSFDEDEGVGAARAGGFAWVSKQLAYVHEVGHLVTTSADGGSAPVFSEGMAELIGPSGLPQYYQPPPDPESFAYLQRPQFSTTEYYPSAQLMSFLTRRYGLGGVRLAYQQAASNATPEEIDEAFVSSFGDEIFDAFIDFQAQPQCPVMLWQCDDAVVQTVELPFALDMDPHECAASDIPGFTAADNDDWYPEYLGVLHLEEARMLRFRVENAVVTRQECQEICTPAESEPPWTWQVVSELLGMTEFVSPTRAGSHHLKIRPEDPQRAFSVEIADVGPV